MASPDKRLLRRLIVVTTAAVVALDATTKSLAVHFLTGRGRVSVLGGALHLELFRNFAGPHNSLQGHPMLVSLLAIAAVCVIAILGTRVQTIIGAIAVGLLLGGGIGNVLDRLLSAPGPLRGGVVDWLQPFGSNGSMNVADLAITAAVVVVGIGAARAWWSDRAQLHDTEVPHTPPQ